MGVRDYFEENNTAYIVMDYIDGVTFRELVERKGGKLDAGELLDLLRPLFPALAHMHGKRMIHRDINPENLILSGGNVCLLDFSCARENAEGDATMTVTLRHGYAPIEQYQPSGNGQGPWTDVYALAATLLLSHRHTACPGHGQASARHPRPPKTSWGRASRRTRSGPLSGP